MAGGDGSVRRGRRGARMVEGKEEGGGMIQESGATVQNAWVAFGEVAMMRTNQTQNVDGGYNQDSTSGPSSVYSLASLTKD
eukprot:745711-Hanusia_phi.AAC.2